MRRCRGSLIHSHKDFEQVERPWQFADVGVLTTPDRSAFVHAFVHIADDIVYTKPGPSLLTPWIMARFPEVVATQIRGQSRAIVHAFRLKETENPAP